MFPIEVVRSMYMYLLIVLKDKCLNHVNSLYMRQLNDLFPDLPKPGDDPDDNHYHDDYTKPKIILYFEYFVIA